MATLWIREYKALARNGSVQAASEPGADQAPVTFSTTTQSAACAASTSLVGIIAREAFHYGGGDSRAATTDALKIPADTLIFVGVQAGQKIAAVAAA